MSSTRVNNGKLHLWALPTLLAALALTRFAPIAVPAMLVLLCYIPGRIVVDAARLAPRWDAAGRFVLCVAASLAVTAVLLNPLWHVTHDPRALLGCIWLATSVGLWLTGQRGPAEAEHEQEHAARLRMFDEKSTVVVAALLVMLLTFATIGPYWPTELRGYPMPCLIHDFVKHHAVLFSLERQGLPLGNPFYADGATGPVYYYHLFYLIPATIRAVAAGLSIELAFGMMSALTAIATAAMFYLVIKRFTGGDGPAILGGLLASAIGSLDIIPVILSRVPVITLDAWADQTVRIHNFLTQMIWSPQNVLGILIMLVGVYALSLKGCWWKGWFVLGPLLVAGIVGSSVWIAMVVLAGMGIFVIVSVASGGGPVATAARRIGAAGTVGGLALAACAPSVLGYAEMSRRLGKGLTTEWPYQSHALLGRLVPAGVAANVLDLPWMLALELGPLVLFPLLLPRRIWRRAWDDQGLRLLLISSVVALAGFVTFRSHFTYNDFGQKTMMVAMAAGVAMAACVIDDRKGKRSLFNPLGWSLREDLPAGRHGLMAWLIGLVLIAGLPIGLYEAPVTAVRRYLPAHGLLGRFVHRDALRATEEGAAYRFLRYGLPQDAVVQADPADERVNLLQIARRQLGVTILQEDTLVFAPPDARGHEECLAEVSDALSSTADAQACHMALRRHRITHLFIGTIELRKWKDLEKFDDARYFEPVFREGDMRVLRLK